MTAAAKPRKSRGAPAGWVEIRPDEWRFEREAETLTFGCRVLVNGKGFVVHVAMTGWSTTNGSLPLEPAEVAVLSEALSALMAWLGGAR